MHLLVINSGSSSVKFTVFEAGSESAEPLSRLEGEIAGVGSADAELGLRPSGAAEQKSRVDAGTPEGAIHAVMDALDAGGLPVVDAVGYRVVHPGAKLDRHQRITDEVLKDLDEAAEFAPLHDPDAVTMIRTMMKRLPDVPHLACFDTVFHQTMPEEAATYPLPLNYREQGLRRYGFHGLSCESIVRRMRLETGGFPRRAAIAHLGSGCSVTALVDGESIDTTMGLTPTGGVVMGTRPGDLDPGVIVYLLRKAEGDVAAVEKMLNHEAGTVALSGMKNDVKAVREGATNGDERAILALKVFTRSVRKAIGAYVWLLGGLDAVIFAGGIGEHDSRTRSDVLSGLESLGIRLEEQEQEQEQEQGQRLRRVSAEGSATAVWVVPAEEDLMIALHVERMLNE